MRTRKSFNHSDNLLLASVPAAVRRRLCGQAQPIELAVADILANPGARIRYVYFPLDSFISLIAPLDRRVQLEVGLVGNEGMLGASLALGQNTEPLRAIVHGAGLAWRVNAATFVRELERNALLSSAVNRYLYVLMCQLAQTSVCTRFHFVDARLARWLLMARDRSHSSKLQVTQELLARVLGVRRVGVTRAATKMRRGTLVLYSRGSLEILDAQRLEAVACECYANAKAIYASMLGAADVSAGGRR